MAAEDDIALLSTSREQDIKINRNLLNENDFERCFHPVTTSPRSLGRNWYKSLYPPEPILTAIRPPTSKESFKLFVFTRLPILNWLWNYRISYLIGDIISGLTLAIMRIPQSLAYAQLAGLPPVYGLYASFVPVIIYSVLGTSKHLSIGTFAVVCLMVSNAITNVLEADPNLHKCLPDYNSSLSDDSNITNISCEDIKVEIAVTLSFLSGLIMVAFGIIQFGFITILLSESLVSGYTTGAAVHVFTSQLQHIFGLNVSIRGLFSVPLTWYNVLSQVFNWTEYVNTATFIISVIALTTLIILQIIDRKLIRKAKIICCLRKNKHCIKKKYKWPIPLPSPLIVVIIAAGISYGASLNERFGVPIVNNIPIGLPAVTVPNLSLPLLSLLQDAFVISVVTFSVSVSVSHVFAKKFEYIINSSQEFIAYGVSNLIGSFVSCMNTSGGLARSTVQVISGGNTQLVGFISSLVIMIVLLFLGPLFEPLPNSILASIIWVALYGMFTQIVDVWRYFKLSISDMLIWIVVFIATVLLGVDLGLAVGVGFSMVVILFRIILPKSSILGRAPNTEIYRNSDNFEMIENIPGVVIYRFLAPLCFINCQVFVRRLELACNINKSTKSYNEGIIPGLIDKCKNKHKNKIEVESSVADQKNSNDNVTRSNSYVTALENDIADIKTIHTLILDCSPIGFMDAIGVKTLQQLVIDFDKHNIQVLFAALIKENRDMLQRVGFFNKCGKEWLFPSIQDAVNHSLLKSKLHPIEEIEEINETEQINETNEESTEL